MGNPKLLANKASSFIKLSPKKEKHCLHVYNKLPQFKYETEFYFKRLND